MALAFLAPPTNSSGWWRGWHPSSEGQTGLLGPECGERGSIQEASTGKQGYVCEQPHLVESLESHHQPCRTLGVTGTPLPAWREGSLQPWGKTEADSWVREGAPSPLTLRAPPKATFALGWVLESQRGSQSFHTIRGDMSLAEKTQKGPKTTQSLVASIVCTRPPHNSYTAGSSGFQTHPSWPPRGLLGHQSPRHLNMLKKQLKTVHYILPKLSTCKSCRLPLHLLHWGLLKWGPQRPRSLSPPAHLPPKWVQSLACPQADMAQPCWGGSCSPQLEAKFPVLGDNRDVVPDSSLYFKSVPVTSPSLKHSASLPWIFVPS